MARWLPWQVSVLRKDSVAIVAVVGVVAVIAVAWWARTPVAGPTPMQSVRILKMAPAAAVSMADRALMVIDVRLKDGRTETLSMPYALVRRCRVGQEVSLVTTPTNLGAPKLTIDVRSCG